MAELRDRIREQSRIARIRMGQDAPQLFDIPSLQEGDERVRVALVPLTEKEAQMGLMASANVEVIDNAAGLNLRDRVAVEWDVWNACRLPDDTTKKVWASVDEMVEDLQSSDIDWLFDQLTLLEAYQSPSLVNMTQAQVDELKKAFVTIEWRELTGRQANALALCIFTLLPTLQQASQHSFGFIPNLTSKSESDSST
jgi:hypothetical protein